MTNARNAVRLALVGLLILCAAHLALAADISGEWVFKFDTPNGLYENPVTITISGDKATVKMKETTLTGTFADSKLAAAGEMYVDEAGYKAPFKLSVTLDGKALKGNASWDTYEFPATGERTK